MYQVAPYKRSLSPQRNRSNSLQDATVREFGGGWNVVDSELNLSTRFATLLDNMSREEDGSMGVRWGTSLFSGILDVNWLDPDDITPLVFDSGTAEASVNGSGAGVDRPNAFYDGNTDQALSDCTNVHVTASTGQAVLTVTGTFATPQTGNALVITAPNDGWFSNVDGSTPILFTAEVLVDGEWIRRREQLYTVATAPPVFLVTTSEQEAVTGVDAVRLTITADILSNTNGYLGVCEVRAVTFTGTGQLPDEVYIVNITYFQDSVIVNLSNGAMLRVLGDGTTEVIWSSVIAGGLVGTPDGWGPTDFVSYAVFNGKLIVCNGTDKPLIVDFNNAPPVQYLADEATGSNVNVPICRYVVAMNKYLIMAGDPLFPDRVHISNQNTSGTWFGDAAPNDGTYVDLGKVGVQGDQVITGVNRYRDQLVVGFFSAAVLGKLGIYTNDDPPLHEPDFNDVIEGFGCHAHRSMVNLGNDLFMLDDQGITSIARSLYSGSTEPKRVSELIDPVINANVNRLREVDTVLGAHAVYNSNDKQYMCFVPNHSEYTREAITDPFEVQVERDNVLWMRIPNHAFLVGDQFEIADAVPFNTLTDAQLNRVHTVTRVITEDIIEFAPPSIMTDKNAQLVGGGIDVTWLPKWTETYGYIYTFVNELKVRAWARYRNWRWRASCRTQLGTVLFADDTRIFVYGNQNNPLYSDFMNTTDEVPIAWQWEMPWADFDQRGNEKHTRFVQLDAAGTAEFTMMMFVDELYKANGVLIPNIATTFVGGDNGGYGKNGQPYGGGRRTSDQRLYEWPSRGKLFKLRFEGITAAPLRIIAVTLFYHNGSIRR